MHHNPEQFLQNRNLALQQEARHKMKPNDFLFAHIQELDGNLSDLGISSTDTDRAHEYLEYLSNSLSEVDRLKDDYELAKKLVKKAPGIVEFLLERDWEWHAKKSKSSPAPQGLSTAFANLSGVGNMPSIYL